MQELLMPSPPLPPPASLLQLQFLIAYASSPHPPPPLPLFLASPLPPLPPSLPPPPLPTNPLSLSSSPPPLPTSPFDPLAASFRPSIAVIIGVLTTMFSLTFLLLLYAKHCKRHGFGAYAADRSDLSIGAASPSGDANATPPPLPLLRGRDSGVDRAIIDILPTFSFSSLFGLKDGLECAVCLSRFDASDILRLLPKCKHAFHLECVDTWLTSHSTCPLCRNRVEPDDVLTVDDFVAAGAGAVKCASLDIVEPVLNTGARRPSSAGRNSNGETSAGIDRTFQVYVQRDTDDMSLQESSDNGVLHRKPSRKESSLYKSSSRGSAAKHGNASPQLSATDFDEQEFAKRFAHRIIIVQDVLSQRRWSDFLPSDVLFLGYQTHFRGQGGVGVTAAAGSVAELAPTSTLSAVTVRSPSLGYGRKSPAMIKAGSESDATSFQQAPASRSRDYNSSSSTSDGHGGQTNTSSSIIQDTFLSRLSASTSRKVEPRMSNANNSDAPTAAAAPRLSSSKIQEIFLSRLTASRRAEAGLLRSNNDRDVEEAAGGDNGATGKQVMQAKQGIFDRQGSSSSRLWRALIGMGSGSSSSSSSLQMPSYQRSVSEVSGIKRYAAESSSKNAALSSDEGAKQWTSIARKTLTWIMGGAKDRPFLQMSGPPG